MRLVVDAVPRSSPGLQKLADEFTVALDKRAPQGAEAIILRHDPPEPPKPLTSTRIVPVDQPVAGVLKKWRWNSRDFVRMGRELNADVVFTMSGIVARQIAKSFGVVTTVNNMAPFMSPTSVSRSRFSKTWWRNWLLRKAYLDSVSRADRVVLHSAHAFNMISRFHGKLGEKTDIVLTGIPSDIAGQQLSPHPLDGTLYFLYFATIHPYKNHARLIDAYRLASQSQPDLPQLLFAGFPQDRMQLGEIEAKIENAKLTEKVKYIGTLDRDSISGWLHHAVANIYGSECETKTKTLAKVLGYGGVMACSGEPPMPEVAGSAAALFDPFSVESIATVLLRLHGDPQHREELRKLATSRARELSWEKCADVMWQAADQARTTFDKRRRGNSK